MIKSLQKHKRGAVNNMTAYETMIKINEYLISGNNLSDTQKRETAVQLLTEVSDKNTVSHFYRGVKFPGNIDSEGRRMYPIFFIPPYNGGKKYKTLTGMTPGTHILSANMYELEILRLLFLFMADDGLVSDMISKTLERLKTTCFGGKGCGLGECFEASLVVLRFLAAVLPADTYWMKKQMDVYRKHFGDKRRHTGVLWYFRLCLSELPIELASDEIALCRDDLIKQFEKESLTLRGFIAKNCLSKL